MRFTNFYLILRALQFSFFLSLSFAQAEEQIGVIPNKQIEDFKIPLQNIEKYISTTPEKFSLIFEKRILASLEAHYQQSLSKEFNILVKFRPDPSPENDELRWKIIDLAQTETEKDFAIARLNELRAAGNVSFFKLMHLKLTGLYGTFQAVVILFFILLLLGALVLVGLLIRDPALGTKTIKALEGVLIKYEFLKPKAVVKIIDPKIAEYKKLLEELTLDEKASEDEIKKAYLERMKKIHATTGNDNSYEFNRLKDLYERICEIRKSWRVGVGAPRL